MSTNGAATRHALLRPLSPTRLQRRLLRHLYQVLDGALYPEHLGYYRLIPHVNATPGSLMSKLHLELWLWMMSRDLKKDWTARKGSCTRDLDCVGNLEKYHFNQIFFVVIFQTFYQDPQGSYYFFEVPRLQRKDTWMSRWKLGSSITITFGYIT